MGIKLNVSTSELESILAEACSLEMDAAIKSALPVIQSRVREAIVPYWKNSPTYSSLISGELGAQLGFYDDSTQYIVDSILDIVANSTQVIFNGTTFYKRTFVCKFQINILLNNLKEALSDPLATIVTPKGTEIKWLQWISVLGDKIIVDGYRFKPQIGKGRSSGGIMIKGGSFRIPSEHSGVIGDNWLTRAIEPFVNDIRNVCFNIIDEEVSRNLS